MEYVIFTVGNAEFLGAIMNGVAAITTSESFTTLISIGLLFGCLFTCWECVMNGTRVFNLQHMLVAFCAYLCMFGPTRTVIIQDVYNAGTGDVVVDNIPLGVAASGSIVSRIGYGICVLIETAYHPASSVATVYQGGFAEPLRILNQVRTFDYGPKTIQTMNEKLGPYTPYNSFRSVDSDIRQAVNNYIRDCTYPEIQMGHTSVDKIKTAPASENPLKSPSTAYHVYLPINIDSGLTDPQTFSCAKGYDALNSAFEKVFGTSEVQASIAKGIGGSLARGSSPTLDNLAYAMQDVGLTGLNAQEVTKNRIINTVLDSAAAGHFKTMQDQATAMATMSAIDQRNIQWASEGTMFTQSMHALMTFIEGFCYAIMPIMAFVFVMGALGMRIVGKYFQILLWIQLWYPIMAIVNLYVISSTKTALKPYATSTSFYDVGMMFHEVETHLGVAGLMLGATPLLALLVITGSSMAFTAIAGRMGGQDHFNEKNIQPDAMQVGAAMNIASLANTNYGQGTVMSGTESLIPTLNVRQAQEGAVQVAEGIAKDRANTMSKNLSMTFSDSASSQLQATTNRNIGAELQSTDAKTYSAVESLARKMNWGTGKDGAVTQEDVGRVSSWLSGGIKAPFTELGTGMKGEVTNSNGVKMSYNTKEGISKEEAATFNNLNTASLQTAMKAGSSKTISTADSQTKSQIESTALGKSMTESVRASKTLTKTQNALDTMGTSYNAQLNAVAKAGLDDFFKGDSRRVMWMNQAYDDALHDQSLSASTRAALSNATTRFMKHGANALQAKTMAYMTLASNGQNGRLGDFAVLANAAGIDGFVGSVDYNGVIPEPKKLDDVGNVGYHGGAIKPKVEKSINNTTAEVESKSGGVPNLTKPENHHQTSKDGVIATDSGNQGQKIHEGFKFAENNLHNAPIPTDASGTGSKKETGWTAKETRELQVKAMKEELDKALPFGNAEGVKDYFITRSQEAEGLMNKGISSLNLGSEHSGKVAVAEGRMREDVVNAYKTHYGKGFSMEKYGKDIEKSVDAIKRYGDSLNDSRWYNQNSLRHVSNFFKQTGKP